MTKYEKYVDDDGVYHYELTLENGSKHWVKKELGDYLHSLEQKVKNLSLSSVSQQRKLLNSLADNFNESTHTYVGQPMIEETLKAFNCG